MRLNAKKMKVNLKKLTGNSQIMKPMYISLKLHWLNLTRKSTLSKKIKNFPDNLWLTDRHKIKLTEIYL